MTQKEKELELITPNFRYEPTFEFYEDDIETIKRLQEKVVILILHV